MSNKNIPTGLGTIILIIIAITVGVFVWKLEKNEPDAALSQMNQIGIKK